VTEGGDDELVARLRTAGCVFAEDEARLLIDEAADAAQLEAMVARRLAGDPLEQILGWAEFCGLRLVVEPGVFVPRLRTTLMVREALRTLRRASLLVDLCCGVGAVAAAVSARRGDVRMYATDVDPAAVRCAVRNLGPGAYVAAGDLYAALPADILGQVATITANAPYVPSAEIALMPAEARDHEARAALDGGPDGLDLQRRIAEDAGVWLAPGGRLLVESSVRQAPISAAIMRNNGFAATVVHDDELDATVVVGVRPA